MTLVNSSTSSGRGQQLYREFNLVERAENGSDPALAHMRRVLRSAWTLPTDTYVTLDIPLLLTRLCMRADGD